MQVPAVENYENQAREDVIAIADEVEDRLNFMNRIEMAAIKHHQVADSHFALIEKLLPASARPLVAKAVRDLDHELEVLLAETARCCADVHDIKGLHGVLAKYGDEEIKAAYQAEMERHWAKRRARRLAGAHLLQVVEA